MLGQRKKLKGEINHISRLIDLYIYKKDFIASKSTQDECDATLEYLRSVFKQAQNDYEAMPSGHRYTGTLYVLKVNYDNTVDRVKINDSAFIIKDLVSWRITSDHDYAQSLYYIRDVYKDKNFKEPIKREDCEPVFGFLFIMFKKIDSSLEHSTDSNYSPLFIQNDSQAAKFARGFLYSYFLGDLSNTKFPELNYTAINVVADYIDYDLMDIDPSYSTFVVEILKDKISSLFISINKLASLRSKRVSNIPYFSDTFRLNNISETFH